MTLFTSLIKICGIYQGIIIDLDKSLTVITALAKDNEEIKVIAQEVRVDNAAKLKEAQEQIDYLSERTKQVFLEEVELKNKH